MNKKQTNYYEIVAKDGDEIIMLDYTFEYGDDFKGATGTCFELVSKETYDELTDRDRIKDEYSWLWQEAIEHNHFTGSLDEYIDELMNDVESLVFDESGCHYHDDIRKLLGVTEKDYPMITCTGGGRMFNHRNEYETVYRQDLLDIISQFETK